MSFFPPTGKTKDIRVVAISDWLDWASGNNDDFVLALPMIQRGSVWRPNQIIDLWDSLLRSMPIGSMLASELDRSTPVRRIGKHESEEAGDNALALLDGQQRTLAMLAGWNFPGSLQMDQRLWIDLGDEPTPGQLFHLHVTTKNRPFGFQHSAPSTKLSFGDRRKAMEKFEPLLCDEENSIEINDVLDRAWADHVKPGSAKTVHTYEMSVLVALWVKYRSKEKWRQQFYGNLDEDQKNVELHGERIEKLLSVIEGLFNLQIPVIPVDDSLFMDGDTDECDPPLAVLFKRIGTGGTALTDNDYIYSVIKHLLPQAYDLVETLHGDPALGVSRLLKPTDLVVSAVRLAIVNKWKEKDKESLDKKQFQSILKSGEFIKKEFLPLIEGKPGKGGKSDISNYFKSIQKTLLYDEENNPCGIPKQMFPLLGRPLVQVLLRLAQIGYIKLGMDCDARLDVLRLVLFWIIAVPSKRLYKRGTKARASKSAYAVIDGKDKSSSRIYGREICNQLVEDRLATRLFSPDEISDRNGLAESKESTTRLRGWNRFVSLENEDNYNHQEVYDF